MTEQHQQARYEYQSKIVTQCLNMVYTTIYKQNVEISDIMHCEALLGHQEINAFINEYPNDELVEKIEALRAVIANVKKTISAPEQPADEMEIAAT